MPKLPSSDAALIDAAKKYVTGADVAAATNNLAVAGGIGQRSKQILINLMLFWENVWGGGSLQRTDWVDEERFARQMILDFINGRQVPYLTKETSEDVSDFIKRTGKETCNIFKLILDCKCQLYKERPKRTLVDEEGEEIDDEEGQKEFLHIYKRAGVNAAFKQIDVYTEAFGYCLARWIRRPKPSSRDGDYTWHLAVVPPTRFDVVYGLNEEFGLNEVTAVVFRELLETSPSPTTSRASYRHEVWTKDNYAVFVDGGLQSVEANIYGRIPYVYCTRDSNEAMRFDQPNQLELALANAEFNRNLSLLNWSGTFSSMPITVVTDDKANDGADIPMVPGVVVPLRSGITNGAGQARIEFMAPQDRSQSSIMRLKNAIGLMLQSNGIQYSATEGLKAGTSGVAVEVSMAPIVTYMKEKAQVDRVIETDVYQLLVDVSKAEGNENLPDAAYVDVEYAFEQSVVSMDERRKQVDFDLKQGLISKAEAKMLLYPEKYATIEQAEASLPEEDATGMSEEGEEQEVVVDDDGNPITDDGAGLPGRTEPGNSRNAGKEQPDRPAQGKQEREDAK